MQKQALRKRLKGEKAIAISSYYDSISISYNSSLNLLLRHMEWFEAADLIVKGMEGAINAKTVTYDFERLMEGAKLLKCSEFGDAMIKHM